MEIRDIHHYTRKSQHINISFLFNLHLNYSLKNNGYLLYRYHHDNLLYFDRIITIQTIYYRLVENHQISLLYRFINCNYIYICRLKHYGSHNCNLILILLNPTTLDYSTVKQTGYLYSTNLDYSTIYKRFIYWARHN